MLEKCACCGDQVLFTGNSCPSCGVNKEAAGETIAPSAEEVEQYEAIIFDGLWDKYQDSEIVSKLMKAGCSEKYAKRLLSDEQLKRRLEAQDRAHGRIKQGWIITIIGAVITAGTFLSAASDGGGVYVVTWGAILFGIVEIFKGTKELSDC